MGLKYYGTIASREANEIYVEIFADGFDGDAEEVFFPAETPILIEWPERDKLEVVRGSNLTLKLISTADRQFVDLYTVDAGAVRIDVYRNDTLYWSGTLDTEIFEEPYSYKKDYDVEVTFSDFGILGRKILQPFGISSIDDLVNSIIAGMCLNSSIIAAWHCATTANITDTNIRHLLIVDEALMDDNGAMTMENVLESVLTPLGLRITQKAGRIHIFDIESLSGLATVQIVWQGADATLQADKVYNNVSVNYAPSSDPTLVEGVVYEKEEMPASTNINVDLSETNANNVGFQFAHGDAWESNIILNDGVSSPQAQFFQIKSVFSGDDCAGIAWRARTSNHRHLILSPVPDVISNASTSYDKVYDSNNNQSVRSLAKLPRTFVPYVTGAARDMYKLRVTLDLLVDARYNFFEASSDDNEAESYNHINDWANVAWVPSKLTLYDANGTALYHYSNSALLSVNSYRVIGSWSVGPASDFNFFLSYYDLSNRKSSSGLQGFKKNKRGIGKYAGDLPSIWSKTPDGEYISFPPSGGYLEFEIGTGIYQLDHDGWVCKPKFYEVLRWVLYKTPRLEVVYANGLDIDDVSIEDKGFLLSSAKEAIKIDTVLGTPVPSRYSAASKGYYFDTNFNAVTLFSRGTATRKRLERLLIGSVYKEYADRKTILQGTTSIVSGFVCLTDAAMNGRFMLLGERQNLASDTQYTIACTLGTTEYLEP